MSGKPNAAASSDPHTLHAIIRRTTFFSAIRPLIMQSKLLCQSFLLVYLLHRVAAFARFFPEYVICFDNFITLRLLAVPAGGYFWLFTHELKAKLKLPSIDCSRNSNINVKSSKNTIDVVGLYIPRENA